jgi:hypothetical protein
VLSFISLASVLGNCLVCLAMYQQPRLRTVMHYSMLSLGKSRTVTSIYISGARTVLFYHNLTSVSTKASNFCLPPPPPQPY